MSLLVVDNLSIKTPTGRLLSQGVNFNLTSNEILVIRGENGVGKTTLLRTLLRPGISNRSKIRFNVGRKKIDYLPQVQSSTFHIPMTVRDAIEIVSQRKNDIQEALDFGLLDERHLDLQWNTASGGEQKRVLLTRSLLKDPDILILDEPLNHLDVLSREAICKALNEFAGRKNKAIVMVSHDLESLQTYASDKLKFLELKR